MSHTVHTHATAQNIRAARHHVGMSRTDVAQYAGLSLDTVCRIETGTRPASAAELVCIADACGVHVDTLREPTAHATDPLARYLAEARAIQQRLGELGVP